MKDWHFSNIDMRGGKKKKKENLCENVGKGENDKHIEYS